MCPAVFFSHFYAVDAAYSYRAPEFLVFIKEVS